MECGRFDRSREGNGAYRPAVVAVDAESDGGDDFRPPADGKKKLGDALLDLTSSDPRHQGTNHPLLKNILLAQRINRASGGTVIAPWEVDQLPWTWLDAFAALTDDLPAMRRARAEAAAKVEEVKKRLKGT